MINSVWEETDNFPIKECGQCKERTVVSEKNKCLCYTCYFDKTNRIILPLEDEKS